MPSLTDAYRKLTRGCELLSQAKEIAQEIFRNQEIATRIQPVSLQVIKPGDFGHLLSVESADTPISSQLGILVGETVNSFRSCLDYLVGELAELESGSRKGKTQFLVANTAKEFQSGRRTFLAGVSDVNAEFIEALQPYNGTSWTAHLVRMNNWDKHNKLIVVAHDYMVGVTVRMNASPDGSFQVPHVSAEIKPSLRIELDDGFPLIESLDAIQIGVTETLDHFAPRFCSLEQPSSRWGVT